MVQVKRIYQSRTPGPDDGRRLLVDRLWPRGLRKEEVIIDEWARELAPSTDLRKWFSHDPAKWEEFKKRYREELRTKEKTLEALRAEAAEGTITLLFSARDTEINNALALKDIIEDLAEEP